MMYISAHLYSITKANGKLQNKGMSIIPIKAYNGGSVLIRSSVPYAPAQTIKYT